MKWDTSTTIGRTKTLVAFVVVVCVSGCASLRGVPTSPPVDRSSYADISSKIDEQIHNYEKGVSDWEGSEFWYSVGYISLAVSSVAVMAFTHGAAKANWLTGIGIGAGALTLFQSAQNTTGKQLAYPRATRQLYCLQDKGKAYSDWPTTPGGLAPGAKELQARDGNLVTSMDNLEAALAKVMDKIPDAGGTAEQAAAVNNSRLVLDQGRSVHLTAQSELDAASSGLTLVASAFNTIDKQAYATAKGASITYAQAAGAFGPPPAQTPPTTVPVKQAPKAYIAGTPGGDLDLAINDATKKANIVVENIKALAAVPAMATKKYSLANAAIGACVSVN